MTSDEGNASSSRAFLPEPASVQPGSRTGASEAPAVGAHQEGPTKETEVQRPKESRSQADRDSLHQYLQGRSISDFADPVGISSLITPHTDFTSPFKGTGWLEVWPTTSGSGSGLIRLIKGTSTDPHADAFVIPFQNVEQIIIASSTSGEPKSGAYPLVKVMVVPTGATGASGVRKQFPKVVQFMWPEKNVDKDLRGTAVEKADKDTATYISVLKAALDVPLARRGKEVIVYVDSTQQPGQSPDVFSCPANYCPSAQITSKKKIQGSLLFLPTGILWMSPTALYFPFNSLEGIRLVFIEDLASKDEATGRYTSMEMWCSVSEPFYENVATINNSQMMRFSDIAEFAAAKDRIEKYCSAHRLSFMKLSQSYYNYARKEMMTGLMPMRDD